MGDTDKTLIIRMKALRREPEPTAESGFPGLVVLGGSDIGKVFYFDEEGRTIGRDPEVAICVGDTSVSRRHAQVYKQVDEDSALVMSRHLLKVSDGSSLLRRHSPSRQVLHLVL